MTGTMMYPFTELVVLSAGISMKMMAFYDPSRRRLKRSLEKKQSTNGKPSKKKLPKG